MAWLTLSEALDSLQQRLQTLVTLTPAQRVLIVEVVDRWRHELQTQERAPGERRKCTSCGNMVPPTYVLDSQKRPTHIMCPLCWFGELSANDLIMCFDRINGLVHGLLNQYYQYNVEESAILLQEITEKLMREEEQQ
jgi:hypothetical protein